MSTSLGLLATAVVLLSCITSCVSKPLPKPTTTPVPTPAFAARWTARQVVDAFKSGGLEVRDERAMTEEDSWVKALAGSEALGMVFSITGEIRTGTSEAGEWPCQVLVYAADTPESWGEVTYEYMRHTWDPRDPVAEQDLNGMLVDNWVAEHDNVLLAVNRCISAAKAARYAWAMTNLQ